MKENYPVSSTSRQFGLFLLKVLPAECFVAKSRSKEVLFDETGAPCLLTGL